MDFIALDVETANADMASICQIGLARYENGKLIEEWKSYIDPEDYFDGFNVSIHGIDECTVKGAPNFKNIANELYKMLDGRVAVSHTHFDRVAINQAASLNKIRTPSCTWLDSAKVVRRTWDEFSWKGYGLYNVCKKLNYEFKHHDALEDAKAAGYILVEAIKLTGMDINSWIERVNKPINPETQNTIKCSGNPNGPMYGEILAFTGALEIPRRDAANMAAQIGCDVASGVTKKTTILVVGDQDITKLAGHEKSSKHRKAQELIEKGYPIRILKESDFKELVALS
ncbi:MAG: transposase [Rhodospirillales bacterium]|nr:transposase [Rhodospirillales bacterium]MCB9996394.1 transposase [Rhodospirillales bacterium]